MSRAATYRALQACMAGGVYRRPGETFQMDELELAPPHLEKLEGQAALAALAAADELATVTANGAGGKRRRRAAVTPENGATADNMGRGKPIKAEDINSADMIKE